MFFGLDLTHARNTGVAFGAFEDGGAVVAVLIGLSLALLLGYFAVHRERPWLWLPVGLLLGGALGNLADRAREGAVIDFIDPVAWPAFNVADSCIVIGVLALLYVVEGRERPERRVAARGRPACVWTPSWPRVARRLALGAPSASSRRARCWWTAAPRPKNHRLSARGDGRGQRRRARPHAEQRRRARGRLRGRAPARGGQAGRPRGDPRRPPGPTLAEALAGRAVGGRTWSGRGSCIAWTGTPRGCSWSPRPRRQGGAPGGRSSARAVRASTLLWSRAGQTPRPARSTRRWAATGTTDADVHAHRQAAPRRHPLRGAGAPSRAPLCCAFGSRPGARIRSARTSPRSATRSAATPPTEAGRAASRLGLGRQFLHAAKLMFSHPPTGEIVLCESKPPVDLRRALDVAKREPVSGGPDGD